MTREEQARMFASLAGSESAGALAFELWQAVGVWDDLIDRDVPVGPQEINAAFWRLLITLPANPFYAQHADLLRPLLIVGVANWMAGNELAVEGHKDLEWFMRMGFVDVLVLCAFLNGGLAAAIAAAKRARLFLKDEEPLAEYLAPQAPKE